MEVASRPDLEAYLRRIGHDAPPRADLDTLRALQRLHTCAIPFENLSPFLGEPVSLELRALEDKLVARRRGGWCFEHNLLFSHVLRAIGFEVKTLAARVRWNVPAGVVAARSHMLMLVTIAGERHVADVGFGGLTLTAPLVLQAHVEQSTPHEPHRLVPAGEGFVLEARLGEAWRELYAFDLHEQLQADYEVSNWYLANFPRSQFVTGLLAARADVAERHTLRNARYSIHRAGGATESRRLATVGEIKAVLEGALRIPLPPHPRLDARLQAMLDANPGASE